ncbi:hypothetical protein IQ269_12250 [Tychonema sp. LEGE 07199]|uniref:hypothetical protein n=1 Tax=unclassified Tychonema TaxID=2642144 RepID=UPI00187F0C33|nr:MULTISPECIES: hypothetical protein [unclassified Tychonema]MBE9121549.1 hypothetical protein [Tychonema sp. LEGE 07199]MBE9132675.1 hypothetical protein [Tychonema sp. LEGE 07196]
MQSAIRITTKVLAGNKLEIQVPPGSVGEEVEVFVIIPEKPPWRRNVLELLTEIRSRHVSRTVEEIDRELQEERNSWDN